MAGQSASPASAFLLVVCRLLSTQPSSALLYIRLVSVVLHAPKSRLYCIENKCQVFIDLSCLLMLCYVMSYWNRADCDIPNGLISPT